MAVGCIFRLDSAGGLIAGGHRSEKRFVRVANSVPVDLIIMNIGLAVGSRGEVAVHGWARIRAD